MVIFYTDTKSLEQELMKFLVQKGKIPYAWQEALISTSAVSIVYYITCIFFACMDKELFCENVHADYWVLLNLIYLFIYDLILFIYYDFIIGNKRNSAPGMERLCSKKPYRLRISSVSKKESWLYNKWYQVWQINNIFDWVRLVKLNF